MLMSFGRTTLRRGLVVLEINCEALPPSAVFAISSKTHSGKYMPAIVRYSGFLEKPVAVLMQLEICQCVTLVALNDAGEVIASISKNVFPFSARVANKSLTIINKRFADRMSRGFSFYERDDYLLVSFNGAKADKANGTAIINGSVVVKSKNRELIEGVLSVEALDVYGKTVSLGRFITMGDLITEDFEDDRPWRRDINFSIVVPEPLCRLMIWARMNDNSGLETFKWIPEKQLKRMVSDFRKATLPADAQPGYDKWFRNKERVKDASLKHQRSHIYQNSPLFSIIVPLYNTPKDFFDDMVNSVLEQSYEKLELLLVNASPENEELSRQIQYYIQRDSRVKVIPLDANLGISENTAAGIREAKGDFVCFLDHDDTIEPDLLFQYTYGINDYPETDMLYCDEDKLLENGTYGMPFLKPDWNPDLLCSVNYVCHMLAVRKSIVDELELATSEYDGAQDHHLTLCVGERARNVFHARHVLYHWRIHEGSTASSVDAKSYTSNAGVRAVQEHYDRMGITGEVRPLADAPTFYEFHYQIKDNPLVSIVIPNKDAPELLEKCVTSILEKTKYQHFEIVIVENNSEQEATFALYDELKQKDKRVRVVVLTEMEAFNFSRIINYGCEQSKGDYYLFLNNDTEVISPEWLEAMLGAGMREEVGVVGAMLLYADGTVQHAGVSFHRNGPSHIGLGLPASSTDYYHYLHLAQNYIAVTGACMLTRREVFEALNGLDEALPIDYNDIDYCMRAREKLGKLVVYQPQARLYHYESVSRGRLKNRSEKAMIQFTYAQGVMRMRYPKYYICGDPYLHPYFSRAGLYRHHDR